MDTAAGNASPVSPASVGLSRKQIEVLALLMQGKSNKAICRALDLAEPTIKYHVTTILKALKAANRTEAVLAAGRLGWKLPAVPALRSDGDTEAAAAAQSAATAAAARPTSPRDERSRAAPTLALPDKPSIVVLPFANFSGDPSQEYFADGMVEDITIALGRLPWLFVIGSSSSFTYKKRAVDVRLVGAELGVRYALCGSVRKEGTRVRIAAQLADTAHGGQIWADSFDGEIDGIFDLQDRVAAQVRTMIAPALRSEEIERARRKPTESLTAYDLYLRALPIHRTNRAGNLEALKFLYRAIEIDPAYGAAYGLAAHCFDLQKLYLWTPASDPRLEEGVRLARLAAETGQNDSEALWMAAHVLVVLAGEIEQARRLAEKAISLNPNSPHAWWVSGSARTWLGEHDLAIEHVARARRLSPREPLAYLFWLTTGIAHFLAGRYEDAGAAVDRSLNENADFLGAMRWKIALCGILGRTEEGREYVQRLLKRHPNATLKWLMSFWAPLHWRNPQRIDAIMQGLRRSGLPEGERP